jgi:hypothetical protein
VRGSDHGRTSRLARSALSLTLSADGRGTGAHSWTGSADCVCSGVGEPPALDGARRGCRASSPTTAALGFSDSVDRRPRRAAAPAAPPRGRRIDLHALGARVRGAEPANSVTRRTAPSDSRVRRAPDGFEATCTETIRGAGRAASLTGRRAVSPATMSPTQRTTPALRSRRTACRRSPARPGSGPARTAPERGSRAGRATGLAPLSLLPARPRPSRRPVRSESSTGRRARPPCGTPRRARQRLYVTGRARTRARSRRDLRADPRSTSGFRPTAVLARCNPS